MDKLRSVGRKLAAHSFVSCHPPCYLVHREASCVEDTTFGMCNPISTFVRLNIGRFSLKHGFEMADIHPVLILGCLISVQMDCSVRTPA
jgi:hypothetical protein